MRGIASAIFRRSCLWWLLPQLLEWSAWDDLELDWRLPIGPVALRTCRRQAERLLRGAAETKETHRGHGGWSRSLRDAAEPPCEEECESGVREGTPIDRSHLAQTSWPSFRSEKAAC